MNIYLLFSIKYYFNLEIYSIAYLRRVIVYNKLIVIGNLTRELEFKYLQNSTTALVNGAIASSYKYKQESGETKEEVCFLDFSMFGKTAEVANRYLSKGSKVMLEGRLVFEQWQDKQTGQNRSRHSLRVDNMQMLDDKKESKPNQSISAVQQQSHNNIPAIDMDEDEIPF